MLTAIAGKINIHLKANEKQRRPPNIVKVIAKSLERFPDFDIAASKIVSPVRDKPKKRTYIKEYPMVTKLLLSKEYLKSCFVITF